MKHEFWKFETKNFKISATASPSDCPFEGESEIASGIEAGLYEWFDCTVTVYWRGQEIGANHLGGCCYDSFEDFISGHRDPDPMGRNCSIMRRVRGNNTIICHYFPSMVAEAIADARCSMVALKAQKVRA